MARARVSRLLRLFAGVLPFAWAVGACTHAEPVFISPAAMVATASRLNHPEGTSYVLLEPATLTTRVKFRSVQRWGLSITARAEPSPGGSWPHLRIELDGAPTHTLVVDDPREIPYWVNFASEPGFADLKLSLLNGAADGDGPTLIVERLEMVPF